MSSHTLSHSVTQETNVAEHLGKHRPLEKQSSEQGQPGEMLCSFGEAWVQKQRRVLGLSYQDIFPGNGLRLIPKTPLSLEM